ncbi:hypothetical protein [Microvirga ossetica]|uniref:hypothetical protein n=1 Tax=Microvirga ossetica TaxID=1882682 RepID=UPI0013000DB0|nr:hypothetical protein [Microvirga ossetica]
MRSPTSRVRRTTSRASPIRSERAGDETLILLDTDGDAAAEAVIALAGAHDMRTGWFVL